MVSAHVNVGKNNISPLQARPEELGSPRLNKELNHVKSNKAKGDPEWGTLPAGAIRPTDLNLLERSDVKRRGKGTRPTNRVEVIDQEASEGGVDLEL